MAPDDLGTGWAVSPGRVYEPTKKQATGSGLTQTPEETNMEKELICKVAPKCECGWQFERFINPEAPKCVKCGWQLEHLIHKIYGDHRKRHAFVPSESAPEPENEAGCWCNCTSRRTDGPHNPDCPAFPASQPTG